MDNHTQRPRRRRTVPSRRNAVNCTITLSKTIRLSRKMLACDAALQQAKHDFAHARARIERHEAHMLRALGKAESAVLPNGVQYHLNRTNVKRYVVKEHLRIQLKRTPR